MAMPQDQIDHYNRRADEARLLADYAASPSIRHIHLEISRNYDLLADDLQRGLIAKNGNGGKSANTAKRGEAIR
ncbi:MAG: hypothetical protein EON56_03685 [Alphaproteobacteria bacterium]|nr:MAG: hypothetical protein EON56_03685 [Alphaproteobacteria bacterium]